MPFNWTELDAMTNSVILPKVTDQIFTADPILTKLKEKKKVKQGGKNFQVNLKIDHLNRGKASSGGTFDISKKEIINAVYAPVKGHYVNLTSDGFDEAINSGSQAVVNLMQEKMNDMGDAMAQELIEQLFGAPATVDPTGKGFDGLQTIISDSNTYLGLDRTNASYKYWQSVVRKNAATPIVLTYALLQEFYQKVAGSGVEGKNIVFACDYGTFSKIHGILAAIQKVDTVNETQANLGFSGITLFGKPVYISETLESQAVAAGRGILYAINFDFLELNTLSGKDFALTEWKTAQNNDLRAKQMIVAGNYVTTKPSRLGVFKDISLA